MVGRIAHAPKLPLDHSGLHVRPAHTYIHTHQIRRTHSRRTVIIRRIICSFINYNLFIYALTTRDNGDDDMGHATQPPLGSRAGGQASPAAVGEKARSTLRPTVRADGAKVRARFDSLRPRYRQTTVRKIMAPTTTRSSPRAVSTPSLTVAKAGRTPALRDASAIIRRVARS